MIKATERLARKMLQSYVMNWEGLRIYREAYEEGNKPTSDQDEHAPWQYRMDLGERMQHEADAMTADVEAREIAAGVDVTEMLYLVDQHIKGPTFTF